MPFWRQTSPQPNQRKYLFALEISPQTVKSAIWSVVNDKAQVLAVGAAANWEDKGEESLISACDQALSDATSHLDPAGKVVVDEVILGLPPAWVDQDKIRHHYLAQLKRLCDKLELKPVGFVVTTEAVVRYLQHSEGAVPTAIMIGFWPSEVEVTLVRMGKLDGTQTVKRSSNLGADVVEGLSRFPNVDVLPSRMLLYDSGLDLEETKQLLLQHPWQAPQNRLPFLHFPKVEILPSDFTVRAIALAGGSEVARAIGLLPTAVEVEAEEGGETDDLGFVADADIRSIAPPPVIQAEVVPPPAPSRPKLVWPKFVWPKLSWPKFRPSLAAILAGWGGLVVALGLAYWYGPKAEVIVWVTPQNFQTNFTVAADTTAQTIDLEKKTLPASQLTVEISGDKTVSTTGSKLVGDKATGLVTIANNINAVRSLPVGAILTSPSGLKFILDEAVSLASGSGDVFNPQPSKTTAKATASQIGADYNLSAGTVFRVGSYVQTETAAKNDAAFSGGLSRQAQVVAEADVGSLKSQLLAQLKAEAAQKLSQQVTPEQAVIAESVATATVTEDFNRRVGEEAAEVTLHLTVKATGLVVDNADLQSLVEAQIRPAIPQGYSQIAQQNQSFTARKITPDQVTFDVSVGAQLLPDINRDEVLKNIRGKRPNLASDYLSGLPAAARVDILVTPTLPGPLHVIPRLTRNISLSIQPLNQ